MRLQMKIDLQSIYIQAYFLNNYKIRTYHLLIYPDDPRSKYHEVLLKLRPNIYGRLRTHLKYPYGKHSDKLNDDAINM